MWTFRRTYLWLSIFLFFIEMGIALFVQDRFIRPFLGDVLVVVLIYCFIRTFTSFSVAATLSGVFALAVCIEFSQYFQLIDHLGWEKSALAKVILGNSFSYWDVLCYALGVLVVLLIERFLGAQAKTCRS